MPEKIDSDYLTIKVSQEKIKKLQSFCQQKGLDIEALVNLFIDACLAGNLQLINKLFAIDNNFVTKSEIELIIANSLQPLLDRLEVLEENKPNINNQTNPLITSVNSANNDHLNPKTITAELEIPEEDRKYLPRHQVWQMLKQTDYVKSCGYDSFLSAAPNQFVEYGIFFDTQKKRFYLKNS